MKNKRKVWQWTVVFCYNVCRQEPYYGLEAEREVATGDGETQNGWVCKCQSVGMGMGMEVSPLRNLCRDSYKGERQEEFDQCHHITNCNKQTTYQIQISKFISPNLIKQSINSMINDFSFAHSLY